MRTLIAFLLVAWHVGPAAAKNREQMAIEKHNLAMRFYDLGRYEDAIAALDEGYLLNPRPSFIKNRGVMLNRLGDLQLRFDRSLAGRYYVRAADAYRHYLDRRPDAPNQDELRASIAHLYSFADRLQQKQQTEPQREPVPVSRPPEPAEHGTIVMISQKGMHEWERAQRRKNLYLGLGFGIAGLLSIGGGVYCMYESGSLNKEIKDGLALIFRRSTDAPEPGLITDRMAKRDAVDAAGWVMLATGAVSVALGFYFVARPVQGVPARSIYFAPTANGAMLGGTY